MVFGLDFKNFSDNWLVKRLEKPESSLSLKYPTLRDHPLRNADTWLEGKRVDDEIGKLWRIHDGLYDFSEFTHLHPGGQDWLILTKGTDITEAFESHHITTLPEMMLAKYFRCKTTFPRNSPFTFKEDGFYRTLKKRVRLALKNLPKRAARRSKYLIDTFVLGFFIFSLMTTYNQNYILGIIAGMFLTMTTIAAHNFFHQRDNFRMYYFDLSMMSSRNWRVSHALSHHLYTNTINDLEISMFEPYLQYLPNKKNFVVRYVSWIYSPLIYTFVFSLGYLATIIQLVKTRKILRIVDIIPLIWLLCLYLGSRQTVSTTLLFFFWIQLVGSFFFGLIGLNAGHHHPDVFHDGDTPRNKDSLDWGLHQLDAVMERDDIMGSHFLVLITFGDHALHHLFPAMDHGYLEYLYPIFKKTCEEFGVHLKISNQLETFKGQFRQLARVVPNTRPPQNVIN